MVVIEPPLEDEAVEAVSTITAKQKLAPSQRMDSVTSAKTNETSTTATSEDYATAPEPNKSTTEEEFDEVEKVEHYLETPEEEPELENNEKFSEKQYSAVCEIQLKSNTDSGLDISESKVKSPTHSFASSSSGSYSVNNTENGRKITPPKSNNVQPEPPIGKIP